MIVRRIAILAVGIAAVFGGDVTASVPADEPLDLGLGDVVLVAPATATAAGARPTFSWEAVPGAASYLLAVLSADDVPLWAWTGTTTEVVLGGWVEPPPLDAPGPLITVPSKWFIVAYDAGGIPVANSDVRPVSP
jgi:hypothetical protein